MIVLSLEEAIGRRHDSSRKRHDSYRRDTWLTCRIHDWHDGKETCLKEIKKTTRWIHYHLIYECMSACRREIRLGTEAPTWSMDLRWSFPFVSQHICRDIKTHLRHGHIEEFVAVTAMLHPLQNRRECCSLASLQHKMLQWRKTHSHDLNHTHCNTRDRDMARKW